MITSIFGPAHIAFLTMHRKQGVIVSEQATVTELIAHRKRLIDHFICTKCQKL